MYEVCECRMRGSVGCVGVYRIWKCIECGSVWGVYWVWEYIYGVWEYMGCGSVWGVGMW